MKSDEKDPPVSNDFQKSQENKGTQLPDFLTSKFGAVIGLGLVILVVGIIYGVGHIDFSRPSPNPLESRPGFASLRERVENLAEVDQVCMGGTERLPCICELAERIRTDRSIIDSLLAADPALKGFSIEVRAPSAATYSFEKLPKAPEESECLNAVAAPTILDEESPIQGTEQPMNKEEPSLVPRSLQISVGRILEKWIDDAGI